MLLLRVALEPKWPLLFKNIWGACNLLDLEEFKFLDYIINKLFYLIGLDGIFTTLLVPVVMLGTTDASLLTVLLIDLFKFEEELMWRFDLDTGTAPVKNKDWFPDCNFWIKS